MSRLLRAGLIASILGLWLLALQWAWAIPAGAQQVCAVGNPDEVLAHLLANSGQTPLLELQISLGPESPTMPAIIALDKEGNFTIVFVSPASNLCFLAIGTGARPSTGTGFPAAIMPGEGL